MTATSFGVAASAAVAFVATVVCCVVDATGTADVAVAVDCVPVGTVDRVGIVVATLLGACDQNCAGVPSAVCCSVVTVVVLHTMSMLIGVAAAVEIALFSDRQRSVYDRRDCETFATAAELQSMPLLPPSAGLACDSDRQRLATADETRPIEAFSCQPLPHEAACSTAAIENRVRLARLLADLYRYCDCFAMKRRSQCHQTPTIHYRLRRCFQT